MHMKKASLKVMDLTIHKLFEIQRDKRKHKQPTTLLYDTMILIIVEVTNYI